MPISHRTPSAMSWRTWRVDVLADRTRRRTDPGDQHHADGDADDGERRTARDHAGREEQGADGRPDELVAGDHRRPSCGSWRCRGRACRPASASACPRVASTNTSAVPERRSIAARTTAMLTCPVAITAQSSASTSAACDVGGHDDAAAVEPVGERSGERARRRSQGSLQREHRPRRPAAGRGSARRPAAGRPRCRMPSPRLVTHDDPTSQRKPVPRRAGRTVSTMRVTSR